MTKKTISKRNTKPFIVLGIWLGVLIAVTATVKILLVLGGGSFNLVGYAVYCLSAFTAVMTGYATFLFNRQDRSEWVGIRIFNILCISLGSAAIVLFGLFYFFI